MLQCKVLCLVVLLICCCCAGKLFVVTSSMVFKLHVNSIIGLYKRYMHGEFSFYVVNIYNKELQLI